MDKSTSTLRFQVWTERVRECHTSGMTVKAWCEQNNINAYRGQTPLNGRTAESVPLIDRHPRRWCLLLWSNDYQIT